MYVCPTYKMEVTPRAIDKKLWGNNKLVVDSGYRGEWFIPLVNTNNKDIVFVKDELFEEYKEKLSDKAIVYNQNKAIAQAVLHEVPTVSVIEIDYDELVKIPSKRGTGALGSSNK